MTRILPYFLFGACFCISCAQNSSTSSPQPHILSGKTAQLAWSYHFPKNVLSNDVVIQVQDKAYRDTRKEVEALFKHDDPVTVIHAYKDKFLASKDVDPQKAQVYGFGWLYAAYYQVSQEKKYPNNEIGDAERNVYTYDIPAVYDYVRLRFILRQLLASDKSLRPLGERLLKINPADLELKYQLLKLIDASYSSKDRAIAIKYVEEMARASPNSPSIWASYGATYYNAWLPTKSALYAKRSTYGYRKYLSLAGAGADTFLVKNIHDFLKQMADGK